MSLYLKRKELSCYSVNILKFHLIHQTLSRRHPPVLQPPVEIFYLIANERHTAQLPKIPFFLQTETSSQIPHSQSLSFA